MPMEITFELSDDDLEHFRQVMLRAREKSCELDTQAVIDNAHALSAEIWQADTSDFIRERVDRLETLIGMFLDDGWGLEDDDRERVLQALAYFSEPEDLIPDDIPGLGFLDDAIMIEIVCRELRHEIQAYRDFCIYRAAESNRLSQQQKPPERSDWLEERRRQLHARMRRRRHRQRGDGGGSSPFSLF